VARVSAVARRVVGDDDDALLERCLVGDEAAFAALVSRHGSTVQRVARRFSSDRVVADEIAPRRRGWPFCAASSASSAARRFGRGCLHRAQPRALAPRRRGAQRPVSARWPAGQMRASSPSAG